MVDNNSILLYYSVTGRFYKNYIQMNGGSNNEEKHRGFRLLTEYLRNINHHLSFHKK